MPLRTATGLCRCSIKFPLGLVSERWWRRVLSEGKGHSMKSLQYGGGGMGHLNDSLNGFGIMGARGLRWRRRWVGAEKAVSLVFLIIVAHRSWPVCVGASLGGRGLASRTQLVL